MHFPHLCRVCCPAPCECAAPSSPPALLPWECPKPDPAKAVILHLLCWAVQDCSTVWDSSGEGCFHSLFSFFMECLEAAVPSPYFPPPLGCFCNSNPCKESSPKLSQIYWCSQGSNSEWRVYFVPCDLQQLPFPQLFHLLIGPTPNNTKLLQLGASGRNINRRMVGRLPRDNREKNKIRRQLPTCLDTCENFKQKFSMQLFP